MIIRSVLTTVILGVSLFSMTPIASDAVATTTKSNNTKVKPAVKSQAVTIELTIPGNASFSVPSGWAMLNEFDRPVKEVQLDERGFFNKVDANLQEQQGKGILTSVHMSFEFDASCGTKTNVDDLCKSILESWKSSNHEYAKSSAEYLKTTICETDFAQEQVTLKTPGGSTRSAVLYIYHCKGSDKLWHTSGLLIAHGDKVKLRSELGYYENAYRYPVYTVEVSTLKDWWDQDKATIKKIITSLVAP